MTRVEAWHAFPAPGVIEQIIDGVPEGGNNCAPATWAGLLISQHRGVRPAGTTAPWWPTAQTLRNFTGDHSGGITPSALDAVVNRYYDTDLIPRITGIETVESLLGQGYAVGLLHGYRPIAEIGLSGSPGFYGAHSSPFYGTDGTRWLDGDPLWDGRRLGIPRGPKWIDRAVALRAAGALVLDGSGTTLRERYGAGKLYIVQTAAPSRVVTATTATDEERRNPMIRAAWGVTTQKVMRLREGQPLYGSPGGVRVTAMYRAGNVSFVGRTGPSWGLVVVRSSIPYADKVRRPTGLYVPLSAGAVFDR